METAGSLSNPMYAQPSVMHLGYTAVPPTAGDGDGLAWDPEVDEYCKSPMCSMGESLPAPEPTKALSGYDEQSSMYATVSAEKGEGAKLPASLGAFSATNLSLPIIAPPTWRIPPPRDDFVTRKEFVGGLITAAVILAALIAAVAVVAASRGCSSCGDPLLRNLNMTSSQLASTMQDLTSEHEVLLTNMTKSITEALAILMPELTRELSFLNASMDRLSKLALFPGVIVPFSGAAEQIPAGWAPCDGGNGTPDLRSRFIMGATPMQEYYDGAVLPGNLTLRRRGELGGEESHTLSLAEMPRHTHTLTAAVAWGWSQDRTTAQATYPDAIAGQASNSYEGGSAPHNNLPPFYALLYIMKL
eukprot:m.256701 g.256701  ORF g.256701 m.256701 type:complete len:359 (-) comp20326_c0_seq1:48-1124(-)